MELLRRGAIFDFRSSLAFWLFRSPCMREVLEFGLLRFTCFMEGRAFCPFGLPREREVLEWHFAGRVWHFGLSSGTGRERSSDFRRGTLY